MSRKQQVRRWAQIGALAAVLAFSVPASSKADDWYPGFPGSDGTTPDSWGGSAQSGLSYAKRAKQWFRSPDGMVTFAAALIYPGPGDGATRDYGASGTAYIVSPMGAPENYGYMPPMTVRSVGFGLMPVEATVQVSQRRKDGYPIPLKTALTGTDYYGPDPNGIGTTKTKTVAHNTVVEDSFNIQILKVKVDGVDLGLTGACRTVTPAPVKMVGPGYTMLDPDQPPHDPTVDVSYMAEWFRTHDPATWFNPLFGGTLSGTMTIPPFTGCTTNAGDDLSSLMTLSVSGPDNPVSARIGWPCVIDVAGANPPLAPGEATPKLVPKTWYPTGRPPSGCNGTKTFEYPERPDH